MVHDELLDIEQLRQINQYGGSGLLAQLLASFQTTASERLVQARTHLIAQQREALAKDAHYLASCGGNLGAKRFAGLAKSLEQMANDAEHSLLETALADIEAAYRDAVSALQAHIEQPDPPS